jgi:CRP/FNR family transcriptional regulator, cyclic AMP receptor protein
MGPGRVIMPSAQQKEFEEPVVVAAASERADLQSLLSEIHAAKIGNLNSVHGRGTVIFAEGEPARGVYILRSGRATVSISSSEGRVVMLRLAQAGDVVGLNSVLRNLPYDTTVKALEPCRTDFISRHEFIEFMQLSEAGAPAILEVLSRELRELTERMKSLVLPQTVNGRLAKLLLEWSRTNGAGEVARVERAFTHEELAQMICSSRETVTRLLTTLTKQDVIRVTSDSIVICNRLALEKIAGGDGRHI